MPTIETRIATGDDDGHENLDLNFVQLFPGEVPINDEVEAGFRFQAFIPTGSTVTVAFLRFTSSAEEFPTEGLLSITLETGNASPFLEVVNNLTDRPRTSAVPWAPPQWQDEEEGANTTTPDLSARVQDVIDGGSWASGDFLAFFITAPSGDKECHSFDADPLKSALIHIEFEVAPPGPVSSIFSRLRTRHNADAWWVVVLGGSDKITGEPVEFHCLQGHNHRALIDGAIIQFRDVWIQGSPVKWLDAIARSESTSDRSFWDSGSSRAGEHRWRFRPDPAMLRRLESVDLNEKFHLCGWGPEQIDGSSFNWDDREIVVRGLITDDRALKDGQVVEVTYVDDELDLDEALPLNKYGGYGDAQVGFSPASGGDPVGLWIQSFATSSFDVDGDDPSFPGWTFEWIGIASDIPAELFSSDGVLVVSGPPNAISSSSWGLVLGPLGDLTFVSKSERFTTGFVPPFAGWFSVHVVIKPLNILGEQVVDVFAGVERASNSVSLVGSFTLAAPVSPASGTPQLTIGNPGPVFFGSGPAWGILTAEARAHDRPLDLTEINLRRARSWDSNEAVRPRNLWRFTGPSVTTITDEDGGVDLFAFAALAGVQQVTVGDGPIPEQEEGIIGRTIQLIYGRAENVPTTDSGPRFDAKIIAESLSKVNRIRSKQAPMTVDAVVEGFFDTVKAARTIAISAGQPDLNFNDFLEPQGDLPGQLIDIIQPPPDPNGIFTIEEISEDFQTITLVENFGGPAMGFNLPAIIQTPATGSGKFAAGIVEELGLAVLDRGEIADLGRITSTASGYRGTGGEEESQLGLFKAVLERRFGYTGLVTVDPSFLDLSPVGEYAVLGSSISSRRFLNTLLIPNGFQWIPKSETFRLFGYGLPGVPTAEINEFDHMGVETISSKRDLRSISLLYARNNTVQDRDAAAGAVPEENRARWGAEGQTVTRDNSNPGQRSIDLADPIVTAIQERDEADSAIDKISSLVFEDREWTRVPCATMRLYDTVSIDTVRVFSLDPIKNWQAGQDCIVMSIEFSTDNTMVFEVMSLSASQTLTINGEPFTVAGEFLNIGRA